MLELIEKGLIESAHDCSDGGLATALAESSFVKEIGIKVELASRGLAAETVLFGEDASRILLSCDRNKTPNIQHLAVNFGLSAQTIGETVDGNLKISVDGQSVISALVIELKEAWSCALQQALDTETP